MRRSKGLLVGKAETVVKNARPIVKIIEVTPMVFIFAICVSMTWTMLMMQVGRFICLYIPHSKSRVCNILFPLSHCREEPTPCSLKFRLEQVIP